MQDIQNSLDTKILDSKIQEKLFYILKSKNQTLKDKYPQFAAGFDPETFPLDIRQVYPGYEKYVLELGCGWGEFALEYSQKNPGHFYLALDKKRYRIKKSLRIHSGITSEIGAGQNGNDISLDNLRWMVCNFDWYFHGLFLPHSFDKVIINFPDPWPKKKQTKHRFIKFEFINALHEILNKDGIIEFATDHWNYMENGLMDFNKSGKFENIHGENVILNQIQNRPESFFESLKREEKENIYIISLKKLS